MSSGISFGDAVGNVGVGLPASSADAIDRAERIVPFIPPVDSAFGFLEPAMWWAENVGGVFPLTPAGSQGNNPGKTPMANLGSGGQWERASRSLDQVHEWWLESPLSNIGLVTQANGILVVDVDPRAGGAANIRNWCRELGADLADVPRSTSPRGDGGCHLWWRLPNDTPRYKVGPLLDGVDIPWQVPVPPSLRWVETGSRLSGAVGEQDMAYRPYIWAAGDPRSLPVAPRALIEAVVNFVGRKRTYDERKAERSELGTDTLPGDLPTTEWFVENGFRPHRRNTDAYALACRLWRTHWPHRSAVEVVMQEVYDATARGVAGVDNFPWSEALSRVGWAQQYIAPDIERSKVLKNWHRDLANRIQT